MKACKRDKQHLVIFVVLYTYQSFLHIERMIYHYGEWGGEVTSFTMNLVCRLISLGFCYRDGGDAENGDKINKKNIKQMPSFWQIMGYTYNTPSCVASPFFEYKDYEEWIELKGSYASVPETGRPGTKRMLTACLWIGLTAAITMFYNARTLVTQDFCSSNFVSQGFQTWMFTMGIKYTYFGAFALNDSSLVVSGLAYNPYGKEKTAPNFDRIKNIDERTIDLSHYLKRQTTSWNISISNWLKKYVYLRLVSNSGGKPGILEFLLTFLISAFWHGFYPGYYMFFTFFGVLAYTVGDVKNYYSWYLNFLPQRFRRFLAGFFTYYM